MNCTVFFLSRSFENNWKMYKLLAHQKISKEKVGTMAEPTAVMVLPSPASSCLAASCRLHPGELSSKFGAGVCMASRHYPLLP